MEYTYFSPTPQPYQQYLNLPPTPTHAGSNSDDFTGSPSVRDPSLSSFSSSSSYPSFAVPYNVPLTPRQDPFDFQNLDAFNQYNQGVPVAAKPPTALKNRLTPPISSIGNHNGYDMSVDSTDDHARRGGSNSDENDEENLTPAQSRRKAQNRAAQRAFRERKERHVKDLEAKLTSLEAASASINEENERLKLQLQKASTENEILKATSAISRAAPNVEPLAGPMRYSPKDFYTEVLKAHDNKIPSHRIVMSESGQRLLAAGAMWDYIIKHPLYRKGLVDVGRVSELLKGRAKCDGQGPVFEERVILEAIEASVASGSDELL